MFTWLTKRVEALARSTIAPDHLSRQPLRAQGERLIFVGGAPRSGTTLLQHIIDSHPNAFGGPEFDSIPAIVETRRQLLAGLEHGRITVFCTRQQIDEAFAHLIEQLLREKTPLNALVFADLLEFLPACRAVHIIRDPRAVVASLLQVGARGQAKCQPMPPTTLEVEAAIHLTKQAVAAGLAAQHRFPQRTLTLIYEELVQQPEPVIHRLCAFLGLTFHHAMLQPQASKHPAQDSLVRLDDGVWLDPQLGYRSIETSRTDVWRRQLDAAQVQAINAAFRDLPGIHGLGYALE
jgi:protein-tyrosine sulfotransferase